VIPRCGPEPRRQPGFPSRQPADDLVSVTIDKLYRKWHQAQAAEHIDAYVRTVLVRSWLDEQRRPGRREYAIDEVPDLPVPERSDVLDRATLLELLARLTPRRCRPARLMHQFGAFVETCRQPSTLL
jgi:DNA-directed RNA polymerase specialized sigma24 family protein